MNRRTARLNRTGLTIVGVLLLLAGLATLLRALGLMPGILGAASAPVTAQPVRELAGDQAWFWPVLAIVLIVVALLSLWWLAAQTRTDTIRGVSLESDRRRGNTRLPARAVTTALEDDLAVAGYLRRISATLAGSAVRPRLRLAVSMDPGADPGTALERLRGALDRSRRALESPRMPATILLRATR